MQDLRDAVVSKHGELADHWTTSSREDRVRKRWRGGIERSPGLCDQDLRAFPEAYLSSFELKLVAKRRERLDDHLNEVKSCTVTVVSSLKLR